MVQTLAGTVAIGVLNLVTGVILARALGPDGRGELAAAILWPTLMRFGVMLGSIEAINFRAARPDSNLGVLMGTVLSIAGVQAAALLAAGAVLLPLILSGYDDTTLIASYIYLGTISLGTAGLYLMSILSGAARFGAFNVLRAGLITLQTLAMGTLAVLGELTVTTAALCYIAGVLPTTLVGAAVVNRIADGIGRPNASMARSLASFGLRAQLGSTRNPLNERLDQFMISIFLSATQLGLYAVAFAFSTLIGFVSATISIVALPTTAANDDPEQRIRVARHYIGITFVSSVAIAAPLAVFTDPIIELVFGESFAPAAGAARILLVASLMMALTRVAISVLNGLERPGTSGIAGFISLGGTAGFVAILIGPLGIEGAALGTLCGYLGSTVWCLARLGAGLGIPPLMLLVPARVR